MQLDRLHMRNFKRYRDAEVKFREGITGILGNNGTGKSTIVEAILFCLFGVKETGLDYILSATAGRRDRAGVRLEFSVRGEEYQLVRTLGPGKKHEVRLHREKRLLAQGVSEVQHALRQVIRMGHADFRYTIFSGQKELLTLVEATPEERKRWFRRVLGIDSLKDEGGGILREEAGAARDRMLLLRGRLGEIDPGAIRAEQEGLARRIAETGEAIAAFDEELKGMDDRRKSLEKDIAGLREQEKEVLRLRTLIRNQDLERRRSGDELAGIRKEMEALGKQEQEFQALSASEEGFEALRGRLEEARARRYRFEAVQAEEARLRDRIREVEEALEGLTEEDASLGRDGERLQGLGPAVARRGEVQARLREIGSLEDRYRTLMAATGRKDEALSGAARRGADLRARIEKVRDARAQLDALIGPFQARIPPGGEPVAALESLHRKLLESIAGDSASRELALSRLASLEEDLASLEEQGSGGACPTCRQPLGERLGEILAELHGEIDGLEGQLARADENLARSGDELAAMEPVLAQARRLWETCSRMAELAAEWEAVQELTRRELTERDRLQKELEALGYDPDERRRLEEEAAALEGAWKEHVAISDRLKRRRTLEQTIQETRQRLGRLAEERARAGREKEATGFDPAAHTRLEGEFRAADERHRLYLAMKPAMDRLPHLEERGAGLARKVREIEEELARMAGTLEGIPFSPEDLSRRESALRAVQAEATRALQEIAGLKAARVHLGDETRRLSGILEGFERDRGEHDRLNDEIGLLELTRDQLNGFTDHLLGVIRDQIQDETGRILSEITDGRYEAVILDDSFELLVHDLGGDFPVSRFSGGEQDDVAIALRIALSRSIAEMHELRESTFLIFDEIFGSQDEERRGNIFRALRALEPYFPQIFLISHVPDVQGEFGNTLVVEAVSGSESRIRDLGEGGT